MAAARLGYRCHIFAPEAEAPAADVAAAWTRADYADEAALDRFAAAVDVVTLEFENVPVGALEHLARRAPVRPGPAVLAVLYAGSVGTCLYRETPWRWSNCHSLSSRDRNSSSLSPKLDALSLHLRCSLDALLMRFRCGLDGCSTCVREQPIPVRPRRQAARG